MTSGELREGLVIPDLSELNKAKPCEECRRFLLDPFYLRTPFERTRARRYAEEQRPAFGDLDRRLAEALDPHLRQGRSLLDLGSGPGTDCTPD